MTYRELVNKLRSMWPEELKRFTDVELIREYIEFKSDKPNDDEKFLEWIVATDG